MKNYIVVALVCQGLGNNLFRAGEECKEEQFAPGHADKLVEQGFLKLKEDSPEESNESDLAAGAAEAAAAAAAEAEAAAKGKKK